MRRLFLATATAGVVALSLTACAGPPADGGSVKSLLDLRKAYTETGRSCDSWQHDNRVTNAKSSGSCDDSTVLSIYADADSLDSQISDVRDLNESLGFETDDKWLVGKNWIINADDPKQLQKKLGGKLVSATRG